MKVRTWEARLILILLLLLAPRLTFAKNVTVDCTGATPGAFTTIAAALASLPFGDSNHPNQVFVTSDCNEGLHIFNLSYLAMFASNAKVAPSFDDETSLTIGNSTNVFISGFNFTGGAGAAIDNSRKVSLSQSTIQNSSRNGLVVTNSQVSLDNSTIQNNARGGMFLQSGITSLEGNVVITGNGRDGISVDSGQLVLDGGDGSPGTDNVISKNGLTGVRLSNASSGTFRFGNDILGNGATGLLANHTSTVLWTGLGGSITGNRGVGVRIAKTSHADFDSVTVSGNGTAGGGVVPGCQPTLDDIDGCTLGSAGGMEVVQNSDLSLNGFADISHNHATGVFVDESSVFASLGGNAITHNRGSGFLITTLAVAHFYATDTIGGNSKDPLECDDSSIVIGKLNGVSKAQCPNMRVK